MYIYVQKHNNFRGMKRLFDEDAAEFRNSRGPAWSRVQMFRDKNVGKRKKEWQQVGKPAVYDWAV